MLRADRLAAVESRLRLRNLAGWLLVPGPTLEYVTGWREAPSERIVLVVFPREGEPFLFTPHFEAERAREATGIAQAYTYRDESGPEPALARAFGRWGVQNPVFGAEFRAMRLLEQAAVKGVVPRVRWQDITDDLAAARVVKDDQEVAACERAARIVLGALEAGRAAIRPGASESEVQRACQLALLEADSYSPFGVMVASGPRSALPHATAAGRLLQEGDLCWLDLGAVADGYCADITRTFPVGRIEPRLAEAYRVVLEAQQAARGVARPGLAAEEVDRAARRVIAASGFGEYFPHRTGHGLGLEDHEAPFIVEGNTEPLRPGMVFTVEPGVYLPALGGVRIEDDLVVTSEGCRVLTDYRRDWLQ